ncbi:Melanization protease 1 [Frankliniella fusca]|uniref:Melanization protease 1 n=1 Tax=Frankliniella fusca TaxID=407009 RepID=A0AAE1HKM3_9NEOP|nr:Melanization protease 1 [Frankliniella fusca]
MQNSGCITDPYAHNPLLRGKLKIVKAAPCIGEVPSDSQESHGRPEVGSGCIPDPIARNPFLRGKFNHSSSPRSNGGSNGPVSPGGQAQEHKVLINPPECGIIFQPKDRIIGGNLTSIMEMKWMARLGYNVHGTLHAPLEYKCGGSLINHRYVLTAAHCFEPPYTPVGVLLGEWDTESESDCGLISGETVCSSPPVFEKIERVILHPQYHNRDFEYDIALVRLRSPVTFTG